MGGVIGWKKHGVWSVTLQNTVSGRSRFRKAELWKRFFCSTLTLKSVPVFGELISLFLKKKNCNGGGKKKKISPIVVSVEKPASVWGGQSTFLRAVEGIYAPSKHRVLRAKALWTPSHPWWQWIPGSGQPRGDHGSSQAEGQGAAGLFGASLPLSRGPGSSTVTHCLPRNAWQARLAASTICVKSFQPFRLNIDFSKM